MRRGQGQLITVSVIAWAVILAVALSPLISPALSKVFEPYWDGECEECHTGFQPFAVVPDSPSEVPEGQEFDFKVHVENPWNHELNDVQVTLDLSEAPNIFDAVGGDETQVTESLQGDIGAGSSVSGTIGVNPGASEILLQMYYAEPFLFTGDLNLRLTGPEGGQWSSDQSDTTEVIRVDSPEILDEGFGEYSWTIESEAAIRSVEYFLTTSVTYSGGSVVVLELGDIGPTDRSSAEFRLTSSGRGANEVVFQVTAIASHDHSGSQPDSDRYEDGGSFGISVGDTYSYSEPRSSISSSTALWYTGRIIAFLTVALFLLSFISGGSIISLKRWLEKNMRNRRKFHCTVSFLTVKLAIVHLLVLYLGYYSGTYKGLILGGISLLLMVCLGLTGIFRDRLQNMIGERNWRRLHLWLSILITVLLVIHAVKEGTDLAFLRFW